jgi:hypothetical protein
MPVRSGSQEGILAGHAGPTHDESLDESGQDATKTWSNLRRQFINGLTSATGVSAAREVRFVAQTIQKMLPLLEVVHAVLFDI